MQLWNDFAWILMLAQWSYLNLNWIGPVQQGMLDSSQH